MRIKEDSVKIKSLLTLLVLLTSLSVFAKDNGASKNGFYMSIGAKGLLGKSASADNQTIEDRKMSAYGGEAVIGFTISKILLGAAIEYNVWEHLTNPETSDNTNMEGKQFNVAPVAGLAMGSFLLMIRPYVHSTFLLDNKDSNGDRISFNTPNFPSFGVQLIYRLKKNLLVGIEYTQLQYNKVVRDGEQRSLTDDAKTTLSGMGLVYGIKF